MSRHNRSSQRKARPRQAVRKRILVVTEGKKTEKDYLDRLKEHLRSSKAVADVKVVPVGKDPKSVVETAVRRRVEDKRKGVEYDDYICLVDKDQHETLEEAMSFASEKDVKLLISNLKFEIWLLWHKKEQRGSLSSQNLDRLVQEEDLVVGKRIHDKFPIENVEEACKRARVADPELTVGRCGRDPSSAMPVLVGMMT